jgi:hypothetical protein
MSDEWISVEERLPKIDEVVELNQLCSTGTYQTEGKISREDNNLFWEVTSREYSPGLIMSWRPLKENEEDVDVGVDVGVDDKTVITDREGNKQPNIIISCGKCYKNLGNIYEISEHGAIFNVSCISCLEQEKKPDFSKLKEGDFIVIDLNYANIPYAGFFLKIENEMRILVFHKSCHGKGCSMCHAGILLTGIKKITRINIDKQTFEEI